MSLKEAAAFVENHAAFFIVSHVSPDGDTLGSGLALREGLISLGKRARMACDAPYPAAYRCLPGHECVLGPEAVPEEDEAVLFIDVSALDRAGVFASFAEKRESLCVDHHVTNPGCKGKGFASANYVEDCAAAGELAMLLLEELSVTFTPSIGYNLYAAIATDTGNFAYSAVNERTFQEAGRLMRTGFDLPAANRALFRSEPLRKVRLNALAVGKTRFLMDDRLAVCALSKADMASCGATGEDCDGIVDTLRDVDTVSVACLLREDKDAVKGSLRSKNGADVAAFVKQFGGGGHSAAAGCTLHMSLEEAEDLFAGELSRLFK